MSTTNEGACVLQTNNSSPSTSDNLTALAGCTPSEWLIPDNKNTRSRFKHNILQQMTHKTPRSFSLPARIDSGNIPWAHEFIPDGWQAIYEGPFTGTLAKAAYRQHDNAPFMTRQLADLVNCFFFSWLRNCFRRKIKLRFEGNEMGVSATSQPFMMKETRVFSNALRNDVRERVEENWVDWEKEYKKTYCEILDSETWSRLGQRVGTFCRDLGCPNATDDAYAALSALRNYNIAVMRDTTSWRLQVTLEEKVAEIRKLEGQLELYQKAIACLSFRGLLENLPDPRHRYIEGEKKAMISATSHWKNFINAAKDEANACKERAHPFATLATDPDAMQHGEALYNMLSDNIHGFSENLKALSSANSGEATSEFTYKPVQFDPGKSKFLQAIIPKNRKADGSVDVEKERERYGVVWDENKRKLVARSKYQDPSLSNTGQVTPAQTSTKHQPQSAPVNGSESAGNHDSSGQLPTVNLTGESSVTTPRPRKRTWHKKPKEKKEQKGAS
ncbi:hypothetical protein GRF29_103g1492844 [Pseudopithomyces chartarum]|uniref:Uncharacterized protein n=1 Tax=Pseudopithomyces chartarum TaxID=1892770 RepID=A0AAN6LWM8_9PLEO|nr:hypothetical protein GRF29_103g1492844 [Pseudopithomyces chartarum]